MAGLRPTAPRIRPRLTTTQRGYGNPHQKRVAALKRDHIEGSLCPYSWCARPMYSWQELDGDHYSDPLVNTRRHGLPDRLAHARCNRRAGALLRWERQRAREGHVGGTASRDW